MRKLLLLLLTAVCTLPASGKLTKFLVRGWIQEQDYTMETWLRNYLDSVYVDIVKADTLPVNFELLRGDNDLKLATGGELRAMVYDGPGTYTVILNKEGFEPLRTNFEIKNDRQEVAYIRQLEMERRRTSSLNEVEITGTAIKMVMKGDTIVYDSAAFNLPEGSTLDALVRQLPGAQLAEDGSITVNGRKVESLLLNGQDFFTGDPDVALKNLPSYTVDKIKVYDRAGKDDALTMASQTITDRTQEQNLVMDVTLKKEFSMATIWSIEGGYGPGIHNSEDPKKFDHRYLGRTFLIGFGKNYRFSAFGNANNIKNTSKSSSRDKGWGGNSWSANGEMDVAMGGFDFFYTPNSKIELSTDLQYSHEETDKQELTAETRFYPTGDLYSRKRDEKVNTVKHLISHLQFRYMSEVLNIYSYNQLDWLRNKGTSRTYTANFSRNPDELNRGAAIDSIFALSPGVNPSKLLRESVMSTTYEAERGPLAIPNNCTASGWFSANWLPGGSSSRTGIQLEIDYNHCHASNHDGKLYLTDFSADPVRREQWTGTLSNETNARTALSVSHSLSRLGKKWSQSGSISLGAGWEIDRNRTDNQISFMLLDDLFTSAGGPLPSMTAPENLRPLIENDLHNSVSLFSLSNTGKASADLDYKIEPLAPSDSGFNPSLYVGMNYSLARAFRTCSLWNAADFSANLRNAGNFNTVNFYGQLSSSNRRRDFNMYFSYSFRQSLPSLNARVPFISSADPFNIYESGADLPLASSHWANIYLYRFDKNNQGNLIVNMNFTKSDNAEGNSSVFDPSTGITYHRIMAVNGNWNMYGSIRYSRPFGSRKEWEISAYAYHSHRNSVDYVASVGTPQQSVVRSDYPSASLSVKYKLKNGTSFSLQAEPSWQFSRSPRAEFRDINAAQHNFTAAIAFYLPWQIEGETTMNCRVRSGYEDPVLNTTEWIWNASVQKSFLKGSLVCKIMAVDLLGQLSNINYRVNAQGRTEVWTNSLPRYAMLTVSYRFSFTPKALQK